MAARTALWILAVMLCGAAVVTAQTEAGRPCDSDIYCYGPILDTIQRLEVFMPDSKTFVDLPLKVDPDTAKAAFAALGDVSNIKKEDAAKFVAENFFSTPEAELVDHPPRDFKSVADGGLSIHKNITDQQYKDLAEEIHKKWHILGKTVAPDVQQNPRRHSLIYLPKPFIIPGGRFREIYYWDSFWTIQGLLVSGLNETAKGMLENFKYQIDEYGHISNGNRVYYTKRSQPPFFALMVEAYINHPTTPTEAKDGLIKEFLPALEKEYQFWMDQRAVSVTSGGNSHILNIYKGGIDHPRPEAYREDVHTASISTNPNKAEVYAHIGAGAESGWDYSTRWFESPTVGMSSIRTEKIVPVDLNAIICAQLRIIGEFHKLTGNQSQSDRYGQLAQQRADAIHSVFWNETKAMWRDFDLIHNVQREDFYISHVVPIFTKCDGAVKITSTDFLTKVMNSDDMKKLTSYPGGFPQSLVKLDSKMQWDFPNAWSPSQMMLIEGFAADPTHRATAISWAQKWVHAVHTGFKAKKAFFEKYDAEVAGQFGGGGEYNVQEGFGWTNGGVLRLLEMFPTDLKASDVSSAVLSTVMNFTLMLIGLSTVFFSGIL